MWGSRSSVNFHHPQTTTASNASGPRDRPSIFSVDYQCQSGVSVCSFMLLQGLHFFPKSSNQTCKRLFSGDWGNDSFKFKLKFAIDFFIFAVEWFFTFCVTCKMANTIQIPCVQLTIWNYHYSKDDIWLEPNLCHTCLGVCPFMQR